MKKIVKAISNHPLWLWRLTLLNHLGLMVYIYYKVPNQYSGMDEYLKSICYENIKKII